MSHVGQARWFRLARRARYSSSAQVVAEPATSARSTSRAARSSSRRPEAMCRAREVFADPARSKIGSGKLTDIVVGGSGIFEGATGTLTGTVRLEGSNARPAGTSTVKLSGTIHYDP